jgi:hypothetical protein
MIWRLFKKNENKYVHEVEPQLNVILRLIIIGAIITMVFGIAGIILKALI